MRSTLSAIAAVIAVLGVGIAYIAFRRRPAFLQALVQSPASLGAATLLGNRLGIRLAVRPGPGTAVSLVCPDRPGAISSIAFYSGLAPLSRAAYRLLSESETGRVRWYAAGITAGSIILIAILVFA